MRRHDPLYEGEAETEAPVTPGGGAVDLGEVGEDPVEIGRGDADALVGDGDLDGAPVSGSGELGSNRHGTPFRRELHSVVDELVDGPLQQPTISQYPRPTGN